MAKSIDPAFQAAPNLGPSSYDPIAFARRNKMEKFQIQRKQQEDQARNTAQGLENLMVDVKGWEDQQGFKEIMADQDRVMNGFMELSRKGMNLVSPKTTQEVMAYKAIQDAHAGIKQKVDTWNQQKGIYDLYTKAIEKDSTLPREEQEIDHEASMANVQQKLKEKSIMERGNGLQNLLVTKTKPVDVFKDILANKDIFEKGTQKQNVVDMPDGSKQVSLVEDLTPQQTESNAKKAGILFESKPPSYKEAIKKIREGDPDPALNVMTDKDYYKTLAVPTYRQKFLNKPVSTGGSGLNFNFLGSQAKVTPGEHQTNDLNYGGRNYNDRYDITSNKPFFIPPAGGEYSTENEWKPIPSAGGPVEGNLLFYDPHTDALVFKVSQDARYPWIKNNTTISIPRKNLAKSDDLPIMVDGKKKTLKDILPAEATSAKKKAYNPKTGKFE